MRLFDEFMRKREDRNTALYPNRLHTIDATITDNSDKEFTISLKPDNTVVVEGVEKISTGDGDYYIGEDNKIEFNGLLKLAVFCRMITRDTSEQS